MKKYACKYVVLRFAPYSETGEFANVGVLLYSKSYNSFVFKLDTADIGARVSKFFHIDDKQVFKFAMASYQKELAFVQEQVAHHHMTAEEAFDFLVKPRATLLRFSEVRTVITDSIDGTLNSVFARMVSHSSASQVKNRLKLGGILRSQLDSLCLEYPFRRYKFSKSVFEVTYDFTQLSEQGEPLKLIQPIEINDKLTPKEIFEVVGNNEVRLNRMANLDLLPKKVLLPFSLNENRTKEADEAWSIVKEELSLIGELVDIRNKSAIEEFAKH
tara:strand:- start:39 stop:854 length:816 start_codon:yes stop_codon:yes gene_type:complete